MLQIYIFRVAQIKKLMVPLERAQKTGQKSGMVPYVWMYGFRDMEV